MASNTGEAGPWQGGGYMPVMHALLPLVPYGPVLGRVVGMPRAMGKVPGLI